MFALAIPFLILLIIICAYFKKEYNKFNQQSVEATDLEEKLLLRKKAKSARSTFYFYLIATILIAFMIVAALISDVINPI